LRIAAIAILSIFLLAGCKSTGSYSAGKVLRDIPREERVALMVMNFKNTTLKGKAAEYESWEFGIPTMIMTDLESIGVFNILSWERLKDVMEQQAFQSYGIVDADEAVEIGKVVAARYILSGSFIIMNGSLRIEAKVFSVENGTLLGASSVTGELDRFFDLEKKLVIDMTPYLGAMLTSDEATLLASNIETTSVDASLDNYAGEMALLQADELKAKGDSEKAEKLIQEAKTRFQDAVKHDPSYKRAKKNLSGLTMAIPMTL
jgi:TolB-like protein